MHDVVITGSSSGIGLAVARRLIADGRRVTGFDRAEPIIVDPAYEHVQVDLADPAARQEAAARIEPVKAFVHAAGIMRVGRLGALDPQTGEALWRLHVDAAIDLANQFAPNMPRGGRIVLIGSRASRGVIGRSQYGAAKAALVALARAWAKELIASGVTVNVVAPAATDTSMLNDPARANVPADLPPIGRLIRPEEVAALVAFLLSGDADAITGQEINICGGSSL